MSHVTGTAVNLHEPTHDLLLKVLGSTPVVVNGKIPFWVKCVVGLEQILTNIH